jgi:hypothetical protein
MRRASRRLTSRGPTMPDFPTAFDLATAKRLETTAQQNAKQDGIDRRLALAILTNEARIFAALSDTSRDEMVRLLMVLLSTYPEAVKEGQPDAAAHE